MPIFNPPATSLSAGTGLTLAGSTLAIDSAVVATLSGAQALTNKTRLSISQAAGTSGAAAAALSVTGGAHTGQTASAELIDVDLALNRTVQRATGAVATQRAALFRAPTYSFVGSSTITKAATLAIDGAPSAGTNATITNPYALWVQSGRAQFDGSISCPGAGSSNSENFGVGAQSGGAFSAAFGGYSNASGASSTALGNSAVAAHSNAIAIGFVSTTTAANQLVAGGTSSTSRQISNVFIGSGVTDTAPAETTYNATGGSGSNIAGAALSFAGGKGTGTGAGGAVKFFTAKAGSSGSALNNLTERARIDQLGNLLVNATAPGTSAERVLALGNGSIVAPSDSADLVQMWAEDLSAGNCTLALRTERAVAADAAVASTHSLSIRVNGTSYRLLLAT